MIDANKIMKAKNLPAEDEVFKMLDYIADLPRSKRLAIIHPIVVKMLQADFPNIPKNVINDLIRDVRDEAAKDFDIGDSFIDKTVDRILKIVAEYESED